MRLFKGNNIPGLYADILREILLEGKEVGPRGRYCGNQIPSGSKPVGTKLSNQFGLYDMSGNIWEWCQDWHHSSYSGAPTDGSAWESPAGSYRVVRGGTWSWDAHLCRSASRHCHTPDYLLPTNFNIGMRVLRTP